MFPPRLFFGKNATSTIERAFTMLRVTNRNTGASNWHTRTLLGTSVYYKKTSFTTFFTNILMLTTDISPELGCFQQPDAFLCSLYTCI